MIQVICPECKGKGKVPCPVCNGDKEVKENIVDCNDKQENQDKENLCKVEDKEIRENNVDCKSKQVNQEKECEICGGTGEVLCTACMGGGIMDTSAFA